MKENQTLSVYTGSEVYYIGLIWFWIACHKVCFSISYSLFLFSIWILSTKIIDYLGFNIIIWLRLVICFIESSAKFLFNKSHYDGRLCEAHPYNQQNKHSLDKR